MGKTESTHQAAGGWRRSPDEPLGKTRRLNDGELTQLLVGMTGEDVGKLRDAAYENLVKIQDDMGKAGGATFIASAFGLLVYEGALSGFSTGGLELDKLSFAHAALIAMSVTGLWLSILQTRSTYITSWFASAFKAAAPSERATLMLRYPAAFAYFQYMRGNRGYPPYVFPKREGYAQVVPIILILLALIVAVVGATALWIAVAVRVWESSYPSPLASKLTVIGCAIVGLLGTIAPRFTDLRRTYRHYGLSNLLGHMAAAHHPRAFYRITRAQIRMGLVKPPTDP